MNFEELRETLKKRGIILENECIYEVIENKKSYLITYQGNFLINKVK